MRRNYVPPILAAIDKRACVNTALNKGATALGRFSSLEEHATRTVSGRQIIGRFGPPLLQHGIAGRGSEQGGALKHRLR